jgi:hypothetical protein
MKKPLPKLLKKLQDDYFNPYIRRRDSEGGYFTCISCSKTLPVSSANAGHYVPVKNCSFLRFHEWNVNAECQYCNCFDEFHLIGYRKNLIQKIGLEAVEWLESNNRTLKKWTREELESLINKYKNNE